MFNLSLYSLEGLLETPPVASQKGATLGAIMRQGRWRHEGTVNGYIEEGQRFDKNAADSILSNLPVSLTEE